MLMTLFSVVWITIKEFLGACVQFGVSRNNSWIIHGQMDSKAVTIGWWDNIKVLGMDNGRLTRYSVISPLSFSDLSIQMSVVLHQHFSSDLSRHRFHHLIFKTSRFSRTARLQFLVKHIATKVQNLSWRWWVESVFRQEHRSTVCKCWWIRLPSIQSGIQYLKIFCPRYYPCRSINNCLWASMELVS